MARYELSGNDLQKAVEDLHRRVLTGVGDGADAITAGRRSIIERHPPGRATGQWVGCAGPHGREGDEYGWPCYDYRDAAAEAGNPLPPDDGL